MAFWSKKTPQDLRRKRLAEIEHQRIAQHEHLDYHYAMVAMQDEQIARLKEEIAAAELDPGVRSTVVGSEGRQLAAVKVFLRKLRGDLEVTTNG